MTARDADDEPAGQDRVAAPARDGVVPAVFDPLADARPAGDDDPTLRPAEEPLDVRSGDPTGDDVVHDDPPGDDVVHDDPPGDDVVHDDPADDAVVPVDPADEHAGHDDRADDPGPEDLVPEDLMPDDAVPDDAVPAEGVPADAVPAEGVPDGSVLEDLADDTSVDLRPSDDELARPLYDPLPPADDEPESFEPVYAELAEDTLGGTEPGADESGTDRLGADLDVDLEGEILADDPDGPDDPDGAAHDGAEGDEPVERVPVPSASAALVDVPARSGWAALARAMAPRATRAQLVAGVLCALLGFAVVVQVRQNDESALSGLRQSELVRVLDETTERGDQLRREVSELRGERDRLASGSDGQAAAIDSLRRSAITQGILSGRLPAQGPGVQVTLLDPGRDLQPVTMLNMLEELRNAGAEAIQLNDHRVTASSAFTGTRGDVLLDGERLEPPYVWLAIGDPSTLSIALQIPGGAMATVRGTGATGTVEERDEVVVTAVRSLPDPAYASPVPVEAG